MRYDDLITLDFEGDPIQNRPKFPPAPCGLSVKDGRRPSGYLSFAHPSGNNSTFEESKRALEWAWRSGRPILFQNAYFDLSICYEVYGLPHLPWHRVHDLMYPAFLIEPHARRHGLKELAEEHLNWPAEEKDAVGDYVWEHRKVLRERWPELSISRSKGKVSKVWQWFSKVPGDILAPYAEGDTDRTFALFEYFMPLVLNNGMQQAYDREREIAWIFYENERDGIRVDTERLDHDVSLFRDTKEYVDDRLRERLGDSTLNIDSDADLAEALSRAGIVDDDKWVLTPSGQRSVGKKNLKVGHFNDQAVFHALGYRNRLGTALQMFMVPWLRQSSEWNGRVSTHWNQTRGGDGGTRTGRPSTNDPNFLNSSKDFEGRTDGYLHPDFLGVPKLPLVRQYVLADDDDSLFLHRDFDGQELRVFAHFECGPLQRAYLEDPTLDPHDWVKQEILRLIEREFERTRVKIANFQSIYGGGVPALAEAMDMSHVEAKEFKQFHDKALPGRKVLVEEITRIIRMDQPIRTWGNRAYFQEPPRFDPEVGRIRDFIYKLINYLVQGSAADLTKQAIIDWYNHPQRDARFLVTVYDEINISARKDKARRQMEILRGCMEKPRLSVPMLSSGKYGPNWGALLKGDPE